ncbi:phosphate acyltransferase PlsX [Acidocella sp.]|uniref:phosphate acyltransferase PlsX n=1 Tax=Acidocella sp. TaxID=50710 RepID=UPI00262EA1F1|nr:phosphate acyltransferase PlsX [Acidocella sp.]
MSRSVVLAVDAMGGDHAPQAIIAGLEIAAERHAGAQFLVFGDEATIRPLIEASRLLKTQATLRHACEAVTGDMKPTVGLRLRDSSMRRAIDAVLHNEAAGVISAGNTGALLALSKIVLKTLKGIDRPAMAAVAPSAKGDVVMLDLGLNVACDSRNLVEFALMGDVFARIVLGLKAPSIGLLNVGSEEGKGDETRRVAAAALRDSPIAKQFYGFVEGHDIAGGTVDVIVTDGFTGNVALKTGEGALKFVSELLKRVFSSGVLAKAGYLLARTALKRLKETLDPRRYNGAVLLGLNGVVVKSHGGTDALGFAHAVDVALDMIENDFNSRIADGLAAMDRALLSAAAEAAPNV